MRSRTRPSRKWRRRGIAFDPTLSVVEGFTDFSKGKTDLLKRSLVQQVATKELLTGTEHAAASDEMKSFREGLGRYPMSMDLGGRNLLKAWRAGVLLVTGSDAGNFLVFHGPTVQREIELWVAAGIPPEVALQAATSNAAETACAPATASARSKREKRRRCSSSTAIRCRTSARSLRFRSCC